MFNNNEEELKLKLSTLDCNTSTKYYQLTQTPTEKQIHQVKTFFKYYTPENFEDLENVAGKTKGWMCKSEDVEKVEKILGITKTRKKYNSKIIEIQRKTTDKVPENFTEYALSFSK